MSDADQVIIARPGGYEGRKENVMKNRLYKAYDFASGHTYLIGEHS